MTDPSLPAAILDSLPEPILVADTTADPRGEIGLPAAGHRPQATVIGGSPSGGHRPGEADFLRQR